MLNKYIHLLASIFQLRVSYQELPNGKPEKGKLGKAF